MLALALGGLALWLVRARPPSSLTPDAESAASGPVSTASPASAAGGAMEPGALASPSRSAGQGRRSSGARAVTVPSAPPPPGCPEEDIVDPEGFVRPSVLELLQLRELELRDRHAAMARAGSDSLREGLRGLHGEEPGAAVDRLLSAPDRDQGGFDVAIAAISHLALVAVSRGELRQAQHHASVAVRRSPDDALAHALAAEVASRARDSATARAEMRRAAALAPDEPALALALARLEAERARFDRAQAAADAYLAAVPDDARTRSWRARIAARRELTADHRSLEVGGLRLSFREEEIPEARVRLLADRLRATISQTARLTGQVARSELAVVLYSDRAAMRRATCAPSWSGGIFDGVLHLDAPTFAADGSAWERVARHEATHAQLALVRGRIPHWLNEGLAQWMEGPVPPAAAASWRRMVRSRFWIPFASLEGQLLVIDDASDARLAYHQSLAMVSCLVDRCGRASIASAVDHLEAGRHEDLMAQLCPAVDGEAMLAYLERRTEAGGQ